jgi:hypothetical protein
MKISKLRLARMQKEEKRWKELGLLKSPPPPPPWTEEQINKLERMHAIVEKIIYGQEYSINLVFELLSFEYLFDVRSLRMMDLRSKAVRYKALRQRAAKEKLWGKMYRIIYELGMEVASLRRSRERGGTSDQ